MSERINVAATAIAIHAGFAAAGQTFAASLARSAARDRAARSAVRHHGRVARLAEVAVAQHDVLDMLGL